MAAPAGFGLSNLIIRWLMALFIVLATYNPSGYSYYHWLVDFADDRWSLKALVGISMLILNLTFFFASLRSLRVTGLISATVFGLVVIWALVDHGYLRDLTTWSWVTLGLILIGSIQAVGVSWSHIRGRLSGQADSNDVTL